MPHLELPRKLRDFPTRSVPEESLKGSSPYVQPGGEKACETRSSQAPADRPPLFVGLLET